MSQASTIGAVDKYQYNVNLQSQSAAAQVARLVGHGKSVLEIGCGPGSQSRVFRDSLGCRVVGLELDPARAALARAFCDRVYEANVETDELEPLLGDERFDVITCADVLEHLRHPAASLRKLAPFLKPGGFLVASVPNATHASVVFEMAHGRFEYRDTGLLDNTHVTLFCRRTLLDLFEQSGYAVAEIHRVSKFPHQTEFATKALGHEEESLLHTLLTRNPDSTTYQFVVKAFPALDVQQRPFSGFALEDRLRDLETLVDTQQQEIRNLMRTNEWLESRLPVRLYRTLRSLFGR
jgi:2-polyprenyl-3-methyl-5-hydroxy-6-metoxy-1,4-benzoquinol methylase